MSGSPKALRSRFAEPRYAVTASPSGIRTPQISTGASVYRTKLLAGVAQRSASSTPVSSSSGEFAQLAGWCRQLVDELGGSAPPGVRERMREAFLTSSRYELAFWEMAWQREAWRL